MHVFFYGKERSVFTVFTEHNCSAQTQPIPCRSRYVCRRRLLYWVATFAEHCGVDNAYMGGTFQATAGFRDSDNISDSNTKKKKKMVLRCRVWFLTFQDSNLTWSHPMVMSGEEDQCFDLHCYRSRYCLHAWKAEQCLKRATAWDDNARFARGERSVSGLRA